VTVYDINSSRIDYAITYSEHKAVFYITEGKEIYFGVALHSGNFFTDIFQAPADLIIDYAKNHSPYFDPPLKNKEARTGRLLRFNISAVSPDNKSVVYSTLGLPDNATFAGKTFGWVPNTSQIGSHDITFIAGDGLLAARKMIKINVAFWLEGDANGDCKVNILDLVLVARLFRTVYDIGQGCRNEDMNCDGKINIFDLVLVAKNFGKTGPCPDGAPVPGGGGGGGGGGGPSGS
jgi:hypothetical protein